METNLLRAVWTEQFIRQDRLWKDLRWQRTMSCSVVRFSREWQVRRQLQRNWKDRAVLMHYPWFTHRSMCYIIRDIAYAAINVGTRVLLLRVQYIIATQREMSATENAEWAGRTERSDGAQRKIKTIQQTVWEMAVMVVSGGEVEQRWERLFVSVFVSK